MTTTWGEEGRASIGTPKQATMNGFQWLRRWSSCSLMGLNKSNLRRAEYEIRKQIKGINLAWRCWYAFRRGLATNLYRCGMRPEQACLILRHSTEVVRRHYIRLEQEGT